MKPYLREFKKLNSVKEYPQGTYFESGFLVTKNASWRSVKPIIEIDKCIGCMQCYLYCPDGVIYRKDSVVAVDYDFCKGCGICKKICKKNAIRMEAEK